MQPGHAIDADNAHVTIAAALRTAGILQDLASSKTQLVSSQGYFGLAAQQHWRRPRWAIEDIQQNVAFNYKHCLAAMEMTSLGPHRKTLLEQGEHKQVF